MISLEKLIKNGQLSVGDALLIEDIKGIVFPVTVKKINFPGGLEEEVIISLSKNKYFIVSMYLDGTSWVKKCVKIINGKIFSLSNSTERYL